MNKCIPGHRSLIPLLLCIFFFVSSFPVQAQESTPTAEASPATAIPASSTTTQEISPSDTPETPSPESEIPTISPLASDTPTPLLEPTGTAQITAEDSPIPTSAASTPTTTVQPTSKPDISCLSQEVFQYQIIVSYKKKPLPEPSTSYTVVDHFIDAAGYHTSVIEVARKNFCTVLNELQNNRRVIVAEPNYQVSLLETIPNDPDLSLQYYLDNIRALRGWDYTTGSTAVTIAIIDSGIDLSHVDLAGKILAGYDFVYDDEVPQDENGHGTHVAGIAAAITNNGTGIAGVSWGAQIMPLRVLDASGNGSYTNLSEAIIWATNNGARVINLSIGGTQYSETLKDAIAFAIDQGVIVVAATGNTGSSSVLYPAAFPGVIGVGATDSANQLASFSNTGAGVDVVAPGVSIFSTYVGNTYRYSSGTSMSAPQVAGFAALLASLPQMQYSSQIVKLIESSAKDLGPTGRDSHYGYGLIQIGPAIRSVVENIITPTPTSDKPHKESTSTSTPFVQQFIIPTEFDTETPGITPPELITPTVTPGEVFMLQATDFSPSPIASSTMTFTPNLQTPTHPIPVEDAAENKSSFLLIAGILYILLGIGLFIYVLKHSH